VVGNPALQGLHVPRPAGGPRSGQVRSGDSGQRCLRQYASENRPRLQWLRQVPHCDTDQSRIVHLVRLISIWFCKWFMLFMTLDMPDEGTR
jgi:hypothetical protein